MTPNLPSDVKDYLFENGFSSSWSTRFISISKGDQLAHFQTNAVTVWVWDDGEPGQRKPGYKQHASFEGTDNLKHFSEWVFLLHLLGLVSMKDFAKQANAVGV
jgi:hypothetical protein